MKKRRTLRRTAKGLMLSAMSLLAATGMLLNASAYSIRIEHIWDDDNNAGNTRPSHIEETVTQKELKEEEVKVPDKDDTEETTPESPKDEGTSETPKDEGKPNPPEVVNEDTKYAPTMPGDIVDKNTGIITDNGSSSGSELAGNKGYLDGVEAAGKLEEGDHEDLPKAPESPKPANKPEEPEKPREEDYDDDEEGYQEALEQYEEEYAQYVTDQDLWNEWQKYEEEMLPFQPEGDKGFDKGFSEGIENSKNCYDELFNKGFEDAVNGETPDPIDEETRKENIDNIKAELKDAAGKEISKEKAGEIIDNIDQLIKETVEKTPGDMWAVEGDVDVSSTGHKDGNPYIYDAVITPESLAELERAGYETTKMQVKVALAGSVTIKVTTKDGNGNEVEEEKTITRTYISLDGKNWYPADDDTSQWDKVNQTTYKPATEYVQETVITFLHTLKEAPPPPPPEEIPGDDDDDDDVPPPPSEKPKDPEPEVPEPEVPLAEAEPEPEEPPVEEELPEPEVPLAPMEEEVPEPNVPLAEVPATGDSLLYWMSAAALSGAALLLLNKREKEDAEA